MLSPNEIVDKMYSNDDYSKWLGISFNKIELGYCSISMQIRSEMTNGFDVAHGGITFAFADSAFAFASNGLGRHAVSIETSISHTRPVFTGDKITAIALQKNISNTLAIFEVTVTNQNDKIVALFKGTVFRKENIWI